MGACLHFEPSSRFCLSLNVVNRHATPKAKAVTFFVTALASYNQKQVRIHGVLRDRPYTARVSSRVSLPIPKPSNSNVSP